MQKQGGLIIDPSTSRDASRLPIQTPAPHLCALRISASFLRCVDVVHTFSPTIKELCISCRALSCATEMRDALQLIVESCPGLNTVSIDILHGLPEQAAWVDWSPLLRCTNIQQFSITFPAPISMADLGSKLSSWPKIRALSLNPRPACRQFGPEVPGPDFLINVAQAAPTLLELHVMLDFHERMDPHDIAVLPTWAPSLRVLDLGYSHRLHDEHTFHDIRQCINILFPGCYYEVQDCSRWVQRLYAT